MQMDDKHITPKERLVKWEFLATRNVRNRHNHTNDIPSSMSCNDKDDTRNKPDAFDCSDLIQPSLEDKVNKELSKSIRKWRNLNERRIIPEHESKRQKRLGRPKRDIENHVCLPYGFDYECNIDGPSSLVQDENNGSRVEVIDLMRPNKKLDYETELLKIFHAIPTFKYLETEAVEKVKEVSSEASTESGKAKIMIDQHQIYDMHAISRIRTKDRHQFPSTGSGLVTHELHGYREWGTGSRSIRGSKVKVVGTLKSLVNNCFNGTIVRIECLKRQFVRGATTDANRLEMEFLGHQTLADVHKIIVQQAQEISWSDEEEDEFDSGLFFIENNFYVAGSVDYSKPIIKWLRERDSEGNEVPRCDALGITKSKIAVKKMASTRLDSIAFRLGVRYLFMFHGDLQASVFFTDTRTRLKHEIIPTKSYPLILDGWSQSKPHQQNIDHICVACQHQTAVVVCVGDELANGGDPTSLCTRCYHALHYDSEGNLRYDNFQVLPIEAFQQDIASCSNTSTKALF